jgi:hypothetical protein
MFDLGSHGDLLPVEVAKNIDRVNLVPYGVAAPGKVLYVTLINREYGPKGKTAEVGIESGKLVEKAETIAMSQENGDISQVEGVTVGGAKFGEDGTWGGTWSGLTQGIDDKKVKLIVPPATAVVVKLTYRQERGMK